MYVPFCEPLTTIRPAPSARCRSLSDRLSRLDSFEPSGPNSSLRLLCAVAPSIGFHRLASLSLNVLVAFQNKIATMERAAVEAFLLPATAHARCARSPAA